MTLLTLAGKCYPVSNYPWPGWFVIPVTFLQRRRMDGWKANPPWPETLPWVQPGGSRKSPADPPPLGVKHRKGVVAEGTKGIDQCLELHHPLSLLCFITVVVLFPVFNFSLSSLSPRTSPWEMGLGGVDWLLLKAGRLQVERDYLTPDSFHSNRDRLVGGAGR